MKKAFASLLCLLFLLVSCRAQKTEQFRSDQVANSAFVTDVRVAGNRRIPIETIKANIQTQPGAAFNEGRLRSDIERLRSLGEFDDVRVSDEAGPDGGQILIFEVREKPVQQGRK